MEKCQWEIKKKIQSNIYNQWKKTICIKIILKLDKKKFQCKNTFPKYLTKFTIVWIKLLAE
jgi:hypothetical protein